MENRKIRNASKHTYNNIEFKSALEVTVYKTLLQEGFNPMYEEITYTLQEKFKPTIPFYTRKRGVLKLDNTAIREMTYTPDFHIQINENFMVIIEVKGFQNDVYPVKKKLFREKLETVISKLYGKVMFFEIYSKRDLLKAIEIIKNEETK